MGTLWQLRWYVCWQLTVIHAQRTEHLPGGHTGHDGKFKPNKMTVEVHTETKIHREEKKKGPPPKKSFSDLP